MDLKKLLTRSLSGIVYCLVIVGAILLEEKGTMMLGALLSVLACVEFSKICHDFNRKNMPALLLDIIGCVALCCGVLLYPLVIWTGIMVLRFVAELYMKEEDPLRNLGHSMMSQIYIGLPMGLMVGVAYLWTSNLLLALFFFIWINDTGAFLVGSTLGKHRLFERISPKKSWEGFFGGTFLQYNCGVAVLAVRYGLFRVRHGERQLLVRYRFRGNGDCLRHLGGPGGIVAEKNAQDKRFRQHYSGSRRHTRQNRFLPPRNAGNLLLPPDSRLISRSGK